MSDNPFMSAKYDAASSGDNPFMSDKYNPGGAAQPGPTNDALHQLQRTAKTTEKKVNKAIVTGRQQPYRTLQSHLPTVTPNTTWGKYIEPHVVQAQQALTGAMPGNDLFNRFNRGTVNTLFDVLDPQRSPLTYLPTGKIADAAMRIPGVKPAVEATVGRAASAIRDTPMGRFFDPQGYLREAGLAKTADSEYEQHVNTAMQNIHKRKLAEDAIVKKNAAEIRQGQMPGEVAQLFHDERPPIVPRMGKNQTVHGGVKKTVEYVEPRQSPWQAALERAGVELKPGTKPEDIVHALYLHRAPQFTQQATKALENARILGDHPDPAKFAVDPKDIPKVQEALRNLLEHKFDSDPNKVQQVMRWLTHRGNQAFLAVPVPHAMNLTGLSYLRYGIPTTVQGLINAVRISAGKTGTGHLAENIKTLEEGGAHFQYAPVFNEMGLTRIAGRPGTEGIANAANKVIVPLERFSNFAQNKILNPVETGMRAAALDAERRAGKTGADALSAIHTAFGTNAPNALSHGLRRLAVPFSQFHFQTAPGAVARAAVRAPGRLAAEATADRDYNKQINPSGKHYHLSVPGFNAARMVLDPEDYFTQLGPMGEIGGSPYSPIAQAARGNVGGAIGSTVQRFTPGYGLGVVASKLSSKKAADRKEGLQDLMQFLLGGSYSTK